MEFAGAGRKENKSLLVSWDSLVDSEGGYLKDPNITVGVHMQGQHQVRLPKSACYIYAGISLDQQLVATVDCLQSALQRSTVE